MKLRSLKLVAALSVVAALAAAGCDKDKSARGGPAGSAQDGKNAPKITALEPKFDFGKVKQGKEVEHVFKVRNQGGAPLLIQKAKGS